jgi:hypothetical protein
MLELLLVSFWGSSMLTCHIVFNKEKLQLDFSLLFLLKNTRCHVSIERPHKDTRRNSNIPLNNIV